MPSAVSTRSNDQPVWLVLIAGCLAVPIAARGSITGLLVAFGFVIWAIMSTVSKTPMLKWTWVFATLWSAAQAVSNYAHGQYFVTALVYMGITIALLASGLYWIHDKAKISVALISAATAVGWIVLKLATGVLATGNPWKYGLAVPVGILVVAVAYHFRASRRTLVILLLALAVTSRVFDNRIQTALFALTAVAVLFSYDDPIRQKRRFKSTLAVLCLIIGLVYALYPIAASEGAFGARAAQQQQRDDANDANYLLSIRKELPMTAYIAAQNPVLGIGSYQRISNSESSAAVRFVEGFSGPINPSEKAYITGALDDRAGYKAHSAAVSSVMFGGLLAAPFWIFLIWVTIRGVLSVLRGNAALPALVFYMSGLIVWDALFSPLNANTHLTVGFLLFLIAAGSRQQSHAPKSERSELVPA
ncbi:hypothetical protein [Rhodococcoides fascians]|uniref:hypothetical protein n=1 Tax=Rhodococcoides fascians TaxID=1828 RepID=UPI00379A9C90